MTTTHEQLPAARGICGGCFSVGRGQTSSNKVFSLYCPHNHSGALLELGPGGRPVWLIYTPLGAEEFEALKRTERPVTLPMKGYR